MHSLRAVADEPVTTPTTAALLDVCNLTVEYPVGRRRPPLRAVDDVSFSIAAGETLGLVGESGSGKTTIGRAILGLAPINGGTVRFADREITHADYHQRRRLSADLQVVFQDPFSSLNPTRTVEQTLVETMRIHKVRRADATERARELLERVGLPATMIRRHPHHFSGGQRQRIAIARALMAQPRLVICDEPTSALDLSVQAQVLGLLRDLQVEFDLSYLFIAHNLPVVRQVSDRIMVLYRGRVMEVGPAEEVYRRPAHPYTQALIAAAPVIDPDEQQRRRLARPRYTPDFTPHLGEDACPFADRCPHVREICRTSRPPVDDTGRGTFVACHRWAVVAQDPTPTNTETLR
jgi:oligopeptide/dipeptide ABC transporter ATP-binding protein